MSCETHPHWLDHPNNIWRKLQVMELLIMQHSPASVMLSLVRQDILLGILLSNSLSLCSSFGVTPGLIPI
jgi:hypothetical protein